MPINKPKITPGQGLLLLIEYYQEDLHKLNQLKIVSEESLMKQTSFASESLRQSADNFRKRIYQEVESEILSKEESHQGGKVGRTLRLDEVYDILRKKKRKPSVCIRIDLLKYQAPLVS